jgi:hypothetical protein
MYNRTADEKIEVTEHLSDAEKMEDWAMIGLEWGLVRWRLNDIGIKWRIENEDGISHVLELTSDSNRVNVTIQSGYVMSYWIG